MTLTQEQRKELIPQLDYFQEQATRLQREMTMVLSAQGDEQFLAVRMRAHDLVSTLRETSNVLKRANAELIRAFVTGWHHFRLDTDEEEESPEDSDPTYESVTYDGNDAWIVVMSTNEHGRERVVVHSDAASWYAVYSTNPA